jgi:hypothetical protein
MALDSLERTWHWENRCRHLSLGLAIEDWNGKNFNVCGCISSLPLKAANLDRSRVQDWVQFQKVFGLHHLSKCQYMMLSAQYNHVWDMRCYTVNCSKHHVENITFSCLWHILHPIAAWGHDHPNRHSTITHLALQLKNQSVSDRRLEASLITDNTKSKNQDIHLCKRGVDPFKFKQLNTNHILWCRSSSWEPYFAMKCATFPTVQEAIPFWNPLSSISLVGQGWVYLTKKISPQSLPWEFLSPFF